MQRRRGQLVDSKLARLDAEVTSHEQRLAKEDARAGGLRTDCEFEKEHHLHLAGDLESQRRSAHNAVNVAAALEAKLPDLRLLLEQMYLEERAMRASLERKRARLTAVVSGEGQEAREYEEALIFTQISLDSRERSALEALIAKQTEEEAARQSVTDWQAKVDAAASVAPAQQAELRELSRAVSLSGNVDAFQALVRETEDAAAAANRAGAARLGQAVQVTQSLRGALSSVESQKLELQRASSQLQACSPVVLKDLFSLHPTANTVSLGGPVDERARLQQLRDTLVSFGVVEGPPPPPPPPQSGSPAGKKAAGSGSSSGGGAVSGRRSPSSSSLGRTSSSSASAVSPAATQLLSESQRRRVDGRSSSISSISSSSPRGSAAAAGAVNGIAVPSATGGRGGGNGIAAPQVSDWLAHLRRGRDAAVAAEAPPATIVDDRESKQENGGPSLPARSGGAVMLTSSWDRENSKASSLIRDMSNLLPFQSATTHRPKQQQQIQVEVLASHQQQGPTAHVLPRNAAAGEDSARADDTTRGRPSYKRHHHGDNNIGDNRGVAHSSHSHMVTGGRLSRSSSSSSGENDRSPGDTQHQHRHSDSHSHAHRYMSLRAIDVERAAEQVEVREAVERGELPTSRSPPRRRSSQVEVRNSSSSSSSGNTARSRSASRRRDGSQVEARRGGRDGPPAPHTAAQQSLRQRQRVRSQLGLNVPQPQQQRRPPLQQQQHQTRSFQRQDHHQQQQQQQQRRASSGGGAARGPARPADGDFERNGGRRSSLRNQREFASSFPSADDGSTSKDRRDGNAYSDEFGVTLGSSSSNNNYNSSSSSSAESVLPPGASLRARARANRRLAEHSSPSVTAAAPSAASSRLGATADLSGSSSRLGASATAANDGREARTFSSSLGASTDSRLSSFSSQQQHQEEEGEGFQQRRIAASQPLSPGSSQRRVRWSEVLRPSTTADPKLKLTETTTSAGAQAHHGSSSSSSGGGAAESSSSASASSSVDEETSRLLALFAALSNPANEVEVGGRATGGGAAHVEVLYEQSVVSGSGLAEARNGGQVEVGPEGAFGQVEVGGASPSSSAQHQEPRQRVKQGGAAQQQQQQSRLQQPQQRLIKQSYSRPGSNA